MQRNRLFAQAMRPIKQSSSTQPGYSDNGSGDFEASSSRMEQRKSVMASSTSSGSLFQPPELVRIMVNSEETFRQRQQARGKWDDSYCLYIGQTGVVVHNGDRGMYKVLFVHRSGPTCDKSQLIGLVDSTDDKKNAVAFVSLEIHESCLKMCLNACPVPGDMAVVFPHAEFLKVNKCIQSNLADQWAGRLVMVTAVTNGKPTVKCVEAIQDDDTIELSPLSLLPVISFSSTLPHIDRWRETYYFSAFVSSDNQYFLFFSAEEIQVATIFKKNVPEPQADDWRSLYVAMSEGNVDHVVDFVRNFIGYVDWQMGESGETALMYAINFDEPAMVNALLQAGASPIKQNAAGLCAINLLLNRDSLIDRISVLDRLIEHCMSNVADVFDTEGRNLLHVAVEKRHLDAVCMLLDHVNFDVNAVDIYERTALHYVADSDVYDENLLMMGKALLSKGADGRLFDGSFFTPLHLCAINGNMGLMLEILKTLSTGGDRLPLAGDVFKPNDGWSPLHLAAVAGHDSIVDELVGNEWCDVNALILNGESTLHLIHSVLNSQLYKKIKPGRSHPLVQSCSFFQVYESLVSAGADLNINTENNGTPLHFALHQLCVAMASSGGLQPEPELIEQLYAIDKTGPAMSLVNDLLPVCANWPQLAIVCYLLCKGASVLLKNPQDMSVFDMVGADLRCLIFYFHKQFCPVVDGRNQMMRTICLFCDESQHNVYLYPCQHMAPFCGKCANENVARALPRCPTCRGRIDYRINKAGHQIATASATEDDAVCKKKLEANERLLCPICFDREKSIRFNCEHFLCDECSPKVTYCPVCRKFITSRTKSFI